MNKSISSSFKSPTKKQELGQVLTPSVTAEAMVTYILKDRSAKAISILDPCAGPGTFLSAAIESQLLYNKDRLVAIDIDEEMTLEAHKFLSNKNLKLVTEDYLGDFKLTNLFDYVVLNPPYVRQEWIKNKSIYRENFKKQYDLIIPGTSNLYVYFIIKAIQDLKVGGGFLALSMILGNQHYTADGCSKC